jgi:hypothetical protein
MLWTMSPALIDVPLTNRVASGLQNLLFDSAVSSPDGSLLPWMPMTAIM